MRGGIRFRSDKRGFHLLVPFVLASVPVLSSWPVAFAAAPASDPAPVGDPHAPAMMARLEQEMALLAQKLDVDDIPEYSMWKAMRELRTPEMKRGIGFLMTFMKNLSNENAVVLNK